MVNKDRTKLTRPWEGGEMGGKNMQGEHLSSWNVLPFSIALSCEKVCGGENGGSGGGKVCKPILVIRLESRPKLINNIISFCFSQPTPMVWPK